MSTCLRRQCLSSRDWWIGSTLRTITRARARRRRQGVTLGGGRRGTIGAGDPREEFVSAMPERQRFGGRVIKGVGRPPRAMRSVMEAMHDDARQNGEIRQRSESMYSMIAQDHAEQNGCEQVGSGA